MLVSPYTDLDGLDNLVESINNTSKRNVKATYYVRKEVGIKGTENLNVKIYEVPGLHAKMFFSEKEALISSGNLSSRPDINWVCILETQDEFDELRTFFENNIKPLAVLYQQ